MRRTVRAGGLVALTVSALLALACESLLGIDGKYVPEGAVSPTGGVPGTSGGAGGTGGTDWGAGGVPPSTGGTAPVETGGAAGSAGAAASDAGCDGACEFACRPGHYKGTFEGEHDPVNIPGLPLFQVSGPIELDIKPDGAGRLTVSGTLVLGQQQPGLISQFQSKIEGGLDCEAAELDAKLTEGRLTPVILPTSFGFEGSLTGVHDSTTRTVSGDWTETQIPATQPTGHGTWTATWVGP